jgi:hypothetical protein
MTDPELESLLGDLHDHLAATASLPVDPTANRWLGEAEAVSADLVALEADEGTVARRVGHVSMLLEETGDTGSRAAEEHVEAARELVERIEARVEGS